MAYAKGQSGNPGGRPRKSEEQITFERKCREWAALFALDKLKRAADSENPAQSVAAVKEILDRGFGKSVETSIIDASVTPQTGVSVEDLSREIAALVGGGQDQGGGADSPPAVDTGK